MSDEARSHPLASGHTDDPLTSRVSSLERDVSHAMRMVESLSKTVSEGFAETRNMFKDFELRNDKRSQDLHTRITDWSEHTLSRGQVSWPLIVAVVVAALALGGGFVSFVRMSLEPVQDRVAVIAPLATENHRRNIEQTVQLESYRSIAELRHQQAMDRLDFSERLQGLTQRHVTDRLDRLEQFNRDDTP